MFRCVTISGVTSHILTWHSDPTAVTPFLKKCFESISSVEFRKSAAQELFAMCSAEKERIELVKEVVPNSAVETWLLELERSMRLTLRDVARRALDALRRGKREEWVLNWPGQVGSLCHCHSVTVCLTMCSVCV